MKEKSRSQLSVMINVEFILKIDNKFDKIGLGRIINPFVGDEEDIPIYHLVNQSKKIAVATYRICDYAESNIF